MVEVHKVKNEPVDTKLLYKPPLPPFKPNALNLTYRQLIAYAIKGHQGQASLREIVTWIQNNSAHYKKMPLSGLDMAVSQTLYDHTAFFTKKIIRNGASVGMWRIDAKKWINSAKRNRIALKKHKKRLPKEK